MQLQIKMQNNSAFEKKKRILVSNKETDTTSICSTLFNKWIYFYPDQNNRNNVLEMVFHFVHSGMKYYLINKETLFT